MKIFGYVQRSFGYVGRFAVSLLLEIIEQGLENNYSSCSLKYVFLLSVLKFLLNSCSTLVVYM